MTDTTYLIIWLGIVIVVAFSVRSAVLMEIAIIAGLGIAMIALALTLHINKRQNDSARERFDVLLCWG